MADEGFLRRWARRKAESRTQDVPDADADSGAGVAAGLARAGAAASAPAAAVSAPVRVPAQVPAHVPAQVPDPMAVPAAYPVSGAAAAPLATPTLDDVARLTPDADFSAFVARGVDSAVRRGALKKLFADPHFHAMDGLDVYIDDYTKPSPVSEAMLASLEHARRVLRGSADEEPDPQDQGRQEEPDNNDLKPRHDEHPRLMQHPAALPDEPTGPAEPGARAAALAALAAFEPPEAASTVGYRSAGNLLVIGAAADALPWADRLSAALPVTVLLTDDDAAATVRLYPVHAAQGIVLSGWLGAFQATWQARGRAPQQGRFDLVLDLSASPRIGTHQHPHGYYAPGREDAARAAAAAELVDMVGDFEKPQYFSYRERLCAHGRNGRTGCNACVDICSAGAIEPRGDRVQVNPYLCAGCGACTTVCPSGAMTYAYPSPELTGTRVKAALRAWRAAGGPAPTLLFHGPEAGALLASCGAQAPAHVLPLGLHHAASTGIDVWLAAIAQGAAGVAVLVTGAEAPQYAAALAQQMEVAQAMLSGLGYAGTHLRLLRADDAAQLPAALAAAPLGEGVTQPAGFNVAPEKRNTLDYALEHLVRHAPVQPAPDAIALPAGSPFGLLDVDKAACSLCMACVGACPAGALQDGQNAPLLRFIEKNCVQCGLCADTCPEDAIRLVPRLNLAPSRREPVVLNETRPFHCIRCDKPFGTLRMVESMLGRLAAHPAFAGNLDRLRMCGDCRVVDMMTPADEVRVDSVTELRRR